MNKFYTALVAIAAVALMIPASADEAVCYTTSAPEVTIPAGTVGSATYIDNDLCQPVVGDGTCTFSLWGYEETNGIPGLQRDDEVHSDIKGCEGTIEGDYLFF